MYIYKDKDKYMDVYMYLYTHKSIHSYTSYTYHMYKAIYMKYKMDKQAYKIKKFQ